VIKKTDGFCCDVCKNWSHWGCSDLDDLADVMQKNIRSRLFIACAKCDIANVRLSGKSTSNLESKVNILEDKLNSIIDHLNILSSDSFTSVSNARPTENNHGAPVVNIADQVKSAVKQQMQEEVSSRSLIISGLPEVPDKSDMVCATELIHDVSSIQILSSDIESVARLGSISRPRNGPRPLRITLTLAKKMMRSDIITKSSATLRKSDNKHKNIYINVDKSPEVLKAEYELRCELRSRRCNGETNITIHKGQIVSKDAINGSSQSGNH
jgi:hypothetical protein